MQYIKLAAAECGYGTEMTRAPRLPLAGREREEILAIIKQGDGDAADVLIFSV